MVDLDDFLPDKEDAEDAVDTVTSEVGGRVQGTQQFLGGAASGTQSAVGRGYSGAADFATDVTGIEEFKQSETGQQLSQQVSSADGPLDQLVARTDAGAKALIELGLDNPNASIQEAAQTPLVKAYQAGSGNSNADAADVADAYNRAGGALGGAAGDLIEGTPLDNAATDTAAFAGEALVVDPANAVLTGTTGIDAQQGTDEGTVGAVDLFDVGVTVGTAGLGGAAVSGAARGADEAPGLASRLASRLGGGSDDATGAVDDAASGVDNAATAGDDVTTVPDDEVTRLGRDPEDSVDAFNFSTRSSSAGDNAPAILDDGSRAADEASASARTVDDASQTAPSTTASQSDLAVRSGTENSRLLSSIRGADDAAGATDDGATLVDDGAAAGDDAATVADDAAQGGDDSGGLVDDLRDRIPSPSTPTLPGGRATKIGLGTGAFVGGGAAASQAIGALTPAQELPENTTATIDGIEYQFQFIEQLDSTEEYPTGGRVYRVLQGTDLEGYWVSLGSDPTANDGKGELYLLDENGDIRTASINKRQFDASQR